MLRIGLIALGGLMLIPSAGIAKGGGVSLSPTQSGRLNKQLIYTAEDSGTQGYHAYAPQRPSVRRTVSATSTPGTYKVKAKYFEQGANGKRQFDAAGTFLFNSKTEKLETADGKTDLPSLSLAWQWGKNYP
jgi:hypothetical protein